jgi:microcin C transport system substrate-binding protein
MLSLRSFALFAVIGLLTTAQMCASARADQPVGPRAAATTFGDPPKYPADFAHWDYANPDAPVGGTLKLGAVGSFDSLNDYIVKGDPAAGLDLIYDSLLGGSGDELTSYYCVVCETVELDPAGHWSIFRIRPEAHFHDGHPIRAEDVVFTLQTLLTQGAPRFRARFSEITDVEALDELTVKFTIADTNTVPDMPILAGIFPILPKHYWQGRVFDESNLDVPLGSGQYRIKALDAGKWITYERVPDYWAKDLPFARGIMNWQEITYTYFRDQTVYYEALKGGQFDYAGISSSLEWNTGFDLPAVRDGRLIKEEFPDESPASYAGFWMNTRREVFADPRVRQALLYLYDFETARKTIHFNQFSRINSYFPNSDWASHGVPEGAELALLEPFRDQLPPELFTQAYPIPVGDGNGLPRTSLRKALDLFKEAGWTVQNGKLADAAGNPFRFEILYYSQAMEKVLSGYVQNARRAGIQADLRLIDIPGYQERLRNYDYDMLYLAIRSMAPANVSLRSLWSSSTADQLGEENFVGAKSPVVDALLDKAIGATTLTDNITASRALDRVLLWNHYTIPSYYDDKDRVAYWNRFGRPAIKPKLEVGIMSTWWVDQALDSQLRR